MPEKLNFLTPTTLKVLEFFFLNSMREFHEREILRQAKVSKGSANKILRWLADLDFLSREKRGRKITIANSKFEICRERLFNLFQKIQSRYLEILN
jgi:CTP-dependent riboflavin kinase